MLSLLISGAWSALQDQAVTFTPTDKDVPGQLYIDENIKNYLTLLGKRKATWVMKTELTLENETEKQRKCEQYIYSVSQVHSLI